MNIYQETLYTLRFCTGNSIWTLKINDKLPGCELHITASQSNSKPDWQYPFIYPFYSTLIAFHQSSMYNSKKSQQSGADSLQISHWKFPTKISKMFDWQMQSV